MNTRQHRFGFLLEEEHHKQGEGVGRKGPLVLPIKLAESCPMSNSATQGPGPGIQSGVIAEKGAGLKGGVVVEGQLASKLTVVREEQLGDLRGKVLVHTAESFGF